MELHDQNEVVFDCALFLGLIDEITTCPLDFKPYDARM